jgi:hypothetical protein
MIRCPNGHLQPDGTMYCATCKEYIVETATSIDTTVLPPEPQPLASLSPPSLTAAAGTEASSELRVESRAATTGRFDVAVTGEAAAFASVDRTSLEVAPATVAVTRLTFRPPPSLPAGELSFEVSVAPSEHPETPRLVSGRLLVEAQPAPAPVHPSAQLQPPTSTGRRLGRHKLIVQNLGADPVMSQPTAAVSNESATVAFRPGQFAVPAGGTAAIEVRVRPREPIWRGRRVHQFSVLAAPGAETDGKMIQRPRLMGFVALGLVVLVGLVALIGAMSLINSDDGLVGHVTLRESRNLNVRPGPSDAPPVVGKIPDGGEVVVDCSIGSWYRLIKPSEHEGRFVFAPNVDLEGDATVAACGRG